MGCVRTARHLNFGLFFLVAWPRRQRHFKSLRRTQPKAVVRSHVRHCMRWSNIMNGSKTSYHPVVTQKNGTNLATAAKHASLLIQQGGGKCQTGPSRLRRANPERWPPAEPSRCAAAAAFWPPSPPWWPLCRPQTLRISSASPPPARPTAVVKHSTRVA